MMKPFIALLALSATALTACSPPASWPPPAQEATSQPYAPEALPPGLSIAEPWAAATPNGAKVGAGYMTIRNNSETADTLVSVASPRAPRVELHEMRVDGDMMVMRPVETFNVPAHGAVTLAPGGYHIMFMDLPGPFLAGESIPLILTFEHAGPVEIALPVRERANTSDGGAHGQH